MSKHLRIEILGDDGGIVFHETTPQQRWRRSDCLRTKALTVDSRCVKRKPVVSNTNAVTDAIRVDQKALDKYHTRMLLTCAVLIMPYFCRPREGQTHHD